MVEKAPTAKARAWPIFDAIVARAPKREVNPWGPSGSFEPDYDTLIALLGVPLYLGAQTRTGVPALALDVWTAYELRRARLDADAVWPRDSAPRTVAKDVLDFVRGIKPVALRQELMSKLQKGSGPGRVAAPSANILGKNYLKQVDVIVTHWRSGPELLISTKRMDSSFGKNAANRVEESYGDAKNLALRHPLAALGFLYSLRSTAHVEEPRQFRWLLDLLIKLGREEDAYDACALVVPEWSGAVPSDDDYEEAAPLEPEVDASGEDEEDEVALDDDVDAILEALPSVTLRHDLVPAELDPGRFFTVLLSILLDATPITMHEDARELRNPAGEV